MMRFSFHAWSASAAQAKLLSGNSAATASGDFPAAIASSARLSAGRSVGGGPSSKSCPIVIT
jgi:hypothetical protein